MSKKESNGLLLADMSKQDIQKLKEEQSFEMNITFDLELDQGKSTNINKLLQVKYKSSYQFCLDVESEESSVSDPVQVDDRDGVNVG